MKKFLLLIICALFSIGTFAQEINDNADNIIGDYFTEYGGSKGKIRVTKSDNGT